MGGGGGGAGAYNIEDLPHKKYPFDWQMGAAVKKYRQFYITFLDVRSLPVKTHKQLCYTPNHPTVQNVVRSENDKTGTSCS